MQKEQQNKFFHCNLHLCVYYTYWRWEPLSDDSCHKYFGHLLLTLDEGPSRSSCELELSRQYVVVFARSLALDCSVAVGAQLYAQYETLGSTPRSPS